MHTNHNIKHKRKIKRQREMTRKTRGHLLRYINKKKDPDHMDNTTQAKHTNTDTHDKTMENRWNYYSRHPSTYYPQR